MKFLQKTSTPPEFSSNIISSKNRLIFKKLPKLNIRTLEAYFSTTTHMKRFPKNRGPSNFGNCQALTTRCKKSDQKLMSEIPISHISMDGCADR